MLTKTCKIHGELSPDNIYSFKQKRINSAGTRFYILKYCRFCQLLRAKKQREKGYLKEYNKLDREKNKKKIRAQDEVKNLSNSYIKKVIVGKRDLNYSEIPIELVQLKRITMQISRILKEKK